MRESVTVRLFRRIARHDPMFAFASVLLLTLGIGALGAMLALYRGTLAQPPALPNWDRLVVLLGATAQAPRLPLSFPDFEDLRRDVPALSDLALTRLATVTVEIGDDVPQRLAGARVTPNLAAVLGIRLARGPGFDVAPGQPADQVVISDRLWRSALAGRPLERSALRVGGRAVEVVGVLPAGVRFPTPDVDLWMPLAPIGNELRRDYAFTTPWGVLAPRSSIDEARQQLGAAVASLAKAFPQSHTGLRVEPRWAEDDLLGPHRPLIVVFALVGMLVFVAVTGNVAALAAARALFRRSETATRLILGAGHRRLLGDAARVAVALLVLACAGGGLLAWLIVRAAEAADTEAFTALRATVDFGVLAGVAAGVVMLGAALLVPAWWLLRRIDAVAPGMSGTRSTTADRGVLRAAGTIVALQLAMCFATVGMLVLARQALLALEQIDLGFDTAGRVSVALGVPELDHPTTIAGFEAAVGEVARLPGVDAVAAISRLPLLRGASSVGVVPSSLGLPGDVLLPADTRLVVGPAHEALGLRLLRGRFLDLDDRRGRPHSVVVDRRFAEQWLAGRDPLDVRLRLQLDTTIEWQVVGVIDDVRWRSFEAGVAPSVLIPAAQFDNIAPMRNSQLVLRGRFDASTAAEPLREALRRGMPLLSADPPLPLAAVVDAASAQARMASRLLNLLSAIALLLALLGVCALLLYRQERQRQAIVIRICLGSSRARVVAAAFADGLALALPGSAVGAALVAAAQHVPEAGRLLASDGLASATLIAAVIVAALALLGSAVPAWRIAQLQPREVMQRT